MRLTTLKSSASLQLVHNVHYRMFNNVFKIVSIECKLGPKLLHVIELEEDFVVEPMFVDRV